MKKKKYYIINRITGPFGNVKSFGKIFRYPSFDVYCSRSSRLQNSKFRSHRAPKNTLILILFENTKIFIYGFSSY